MKSRDYLVEDFAPNFNCQANNVDDGCFMTTSTQNYNVYTMLGIYIKVRRTVH